MEWTWGPRDTWERLRAFLEATGRRFAHARALLVVSAHWEAPVVTVQSSPRPPLLYDYYGFPPHTYALRWPAPGAPELARRARMLLRAAGIESAEDPERGFDHGVFVPLKVAFPDAHLPTFQVSLVEGLDPALHLRIGEALAPLRDEGVLIVGSGMSFHNLGLFGRSADPAVDEASRAFDAWLEAVCTGDPDERAAALEHWETAPYARLCHPREEHLLPLLVAAGAATGELGRHLFRDKVMGSWISAFEFGTPTPAAPTP
ncbi:MAG: dioxygenase [Deltaproteobacteria bacterium]|nr:MAG: dioxygenase [Deltaproteobacteria bacterium]